jgi:hypothetical protein
MFRNFDKQFAEDALLSCIETIEEGLVISVRDLGENGEATQSRACGGKYTESAVTLVPFRLNPAFRFKLIDDLGHCSACQSNRRGQLAGRGLTPLV